MDGIIDVLNYVPQPVEVAFQPEKINSLLGTNLSSDEMVSLLTRLGFTLEGNMLDVPSWRTDIHYMADVAEEVARMYGYDKIPVTMFRGATAQGGYTDTQKKQNLTGSICRGMGYSEILTYSFGQPCHVRSNSSAQGQSFTERDSDHQPPGRGHLHYAHHYPALHDGHAVPK